MRFIIIGPAHLTVRSSVYISVPPDVDPCCPQTEMDPEATFSCYGASRHFYFESTPNLGVELVQFQTAAQRLCCCDQSCEQGLVSAVDCSGRAGLWRSTPTSSKVNERTYRTSKCRAAGWTGSTIAPRRGLHRCQSGPDTQPTWLLMARPLPPSRWRSKRGGFRSVLPDLDSFSSLQRSCF